LSLPKFPNFVLINKMMDQKHYYHRDEIIIYTNFARRKRGSIIPT